MVIHANTSVSSTSVNRWITTCCFRHCVLCLFYSFLLAFLATRFYFVTYYIPQKSYCCWFVRRFESTLCLMQLQNIQKTAQHQLQVVVVRVSVMQAFLRQQHDSNNNSIYKPIKATPVCTYYSVQRYPFFLNKHNNIVYTFIKQQRTRNSPNLYPLENFFNQMCSYFFQCKTKQSRFIHLSSAFLYQSIHRRITR